MKSNMNCGNSGEIDSIDTNGQKNGKMLPAVVSADISFEQRQFSEPCQPRSVLPRLIVLGGLQQQLRQVLEEDYSVYQKGTITLYTGNHMTLPWENGETNFIGYVNCPYAYKEGIWYVYYKGRWNLCEPEEVQEYVYIGDRLRSVGRISREELSAYKIGVITKSTESWNIAPTINGQTNISAMVGNEYSLVDGEWYLHRFDAWHHLQPVQNEINSVEAYNHFSATRE